MRRDFSNYLLVATLAGAGFACEQGPDTDGMDEVGGIEDTSGIGETTGTGETGDALVPCEQRMEGGCIGLEDPNDEFGATCTWASLIPLPDQGNSCAMGEPVGRCMAVEPVLDGCSGAPELECTLGDTTEYGTGAVIELDGVVYLYDGSFDCWPPSPMTTCETSDTQAGCECACDRILGG